MHKELGLRYKWYRTGLEISIKMHWWGLADWFWQRKMTRFFITFQQESDYKRTFNIGKKKLTETIIHSGW